jgi:hypothetical protein
MVTLSAFCQKAKGDRFNFLDHSFGNGGDMARAAPAVLANDLPRKMQKQK